jgi:malate dehydrogenase (oxaloacetate-decarboxylating)
MAICAAHSLADYAERRGINPDDIVPTMDEASVFPHESADVAMQAIKDGVARVQITREEAFGMASRDIEHARSMTRFLTENGFIEKPPVEMVKKALQWAVEQVSA